LVCNIWPNVNTLPWSLFPVYLSTANMLINTFLYERAWYELVYCWFPGIHFFFLIWVWRCCWFQMIMLEFALSWALKYPVCYILSTFYVNDNYMVTMSGMTVNSSAFWNTQVFRVLNTKVSFFELYGCYWILTKHFSKW